MAGPSAALTYYVMPTGFVGIIKMRILPKYPRRVCGGRGNFLTHARAILQFALRQLKISLIKSG